MSKCDPNNKRTQTNYEAGRSDLHRRVEIETYFVGDKPLQRIKDLKPIVGVPVDGIKRKFNGLEANIQPADYPVPEHDREILIVACGIGTDSIAMLAEMKNRGIRPDLVQWADTGSEQSHTYRYVNTLIAWLEENDFPPLLIVRKRCPKAGHRSLYEQLWNTEQLPSPKFHRNHSCSAKWKLEPQRDYHSFLPWLQTASTAIGFSAEETKRRGTIEAIGFSAEETERRSYQQTDVAGYVTTYPLQEWGITREDCVEIIDAAGLPQPGKSACFFCPMMNLCELRRMDSHQLEAAFALEHRADAGGKIKKQTGLRKGVEQHWSDWLEETKDLEVEEPVGLVATV